MKSPILSASRHPAALVFTLLLALQGVACNPPDMTGPQTEPEPGVDLSGAWAFTDHASSAGGGVGNRWLLEAVLDLDQDGNGRITGTQTGSELSQVVCSGMFGCLTSVERWGALQVTGSVVGREVTLHLTVDPEGTRRTYVGTVREDRIQGEGWWAERTGSTDPSGPTGRPLPAPTALSATVDASTSSVLLNWTDNSSDEDGFAVAGRCDGADWDVWGVTDPDVTSARVTGFSGGETCEIAVFAVRQAGEEWVASDPSNVVTVVIP